MRQFVSPLLLPTGASLLALAACGGGGGGGGNAAPAAGEPLVAVAQPGELVALARLRLAASNRSPGLATPGAPGLALASADAGGSTTVLRSATLVQEAGVDEPDLIKSDTRQVYTLDDNTWNPATATAHLRLQAHTLQADGSTRPAASLNLGDTAGASAVLHGLLLAPGVQRLAALSEWVRYTLLPMPQPCAAEVCASLRPDVVAQQSELRVHLVATGTAGSLPPATELAISGRLVGSRLLGQHLVLVTTHEPQLNASSAAERSAALANLQAADLLPRLRIGSQPAQPLLAETDCYLQTADTSPAPGLQLTTITVLDLGQAMPTPRSRCYVGPAQALYLSTRHLYLAATRAHTEADAGGPLRYTGQLLTDIHKFDLQGLAWRGSGQVDGHLGWDTARMSYRLGEHGEHLRVLSHTGATGWATLQDAALRSASPATLSVLREAGDGRHLRLVATLPNAQQPAALGKPGEQIHGVRFVGERGYLVTFRRTDPLYVLDLADPGNPRLAGALEVPGFSDHLFPLANGLLLGTGHDADANGVVTGLRYTLFDVASPSQPLALASVVLGQRGSASTLGYTPHGLALRADAEQVRLAVPVVLTASDYGNATAGVQRLQVDTAARTLQAGPLLPVAAAQSQGLWGQRLMHSGNHLLHLVGGALLAHGW